MAIRYNDLYLNLRRMLKNAGAVDPTQTARELLCTASGKTKNELLRDGQLYAASPVEQQAYALAQRHLDGEPVAYLVGEWEFYGVTLDISPAVLIPRPDTEVLVEQVLARLRRDGKYRILDLCAGSGCIGLALASRLPDAHVLLGELDEQALGLCRQNIRRNGLGGRVAALHIDARERPQRQLGEFDCIVSNPPYIPHGDIEGLDPSVRDHEPHLALDGGEDGLDFYRVITDRWREALCDGGLLAFEVGIGEADAVLRIMRSNGFGDGEIIKDLNGIPRVVVGRLYQSI